MNQWGENNLIITENIWLPDWTEVQGSDKEALSEIWDSGVPVCSDILLTIAALMILLTKLRFL